MRRLLASPPSLEPSTPTATRTIFSLLPTLRRDAAIGKFLGQDLALDARAREGIPLAFWVLLHGCWEQPGGACCTASLVWAVRPFVWHRRARGLSPVRYCASAASPVVYSRSGLHRAAAAALWCRPRASGTLFALGLRGRSVDLPVRRPLGLRGSLLGGPFIGLPSCTLLCGPRPLGSADTVHCCRSRLVEPVPPCIAVGPLPAAASGHSVWCVPSPLCVSSLSGLTSLIGVCLVLRGC